MNLQKSLESIAQHRTFSSGAGLTYVLGTCDKNVLLKVTSILKFLLVFFPSSLLSLAL